MNPVTWIAIISGVAALLATVFLLVRQVRKQRTFPELSEGVAIDGVPSEASSTPTYELDIASGRMQWNDAFYNTFGYHLSEHAGSLEWWTDHVHPDDAMALNATMDKLLDSESAGWTTYYRFRVADGAYVRIREEAYIRRDEDGTALHLTGLLTVLKK
jgi:PAS domain-containing protein